MSEYQYTDGSKRTSLHVSDQMLKRIAGEIIQEEFQEKKGKKRENGRSKSKQVKSRVE